jgi:hypothetical protein
MPNFLTELKSNLKKIEGDGLSSEQVKLLDADPEMSRKGESFKQKFAIVYVPNHDCIP